MISKTDIKQLSRLSTKKGHNESGLYLIKGLRIIRSALRAQAPINRIFITAKSNLVAIDVLSNKSKHIWSFQPHIEATQAFLDNHGLLLADPQKTFDFGYRFMDTFIISLV